MYDHILNKLDPPLPDDTTLVADGVLQAINETVPDAYEADPGGLTIDVIRALCENAITDLSSLAPDNDVRRELLDHIRSIADHTRT